jgi:glycerophosphoryl diester phosphodiesterase
MAMYETTPLLPDKMASEFRQSQHTSWQNTANNPPASFTSAFVTSDGRRRPQAIAHRGYKDAWPENTMGAFKGAVGVGSHAIETDIHLSKDGVVVISHVRASLCY